MSFEKVAEKIKWVQFVYYSGPVQALGGNVP